MPQLIFTTMKDKKNKNLLGKTLVSSSYALCRMKHKDYSGYIERKWHLINDVGVGSNEYTLCGLATPDSTISREGFELEKFKMGGKITCQDCLKLLNWCRRVS